MLIIRKGVGIAGGGGGGGAFLLDSITPQPTAAFSTRRLRAAYAGNCMKVNIDSGLVPQDIGFVSDDIDQSAVDAFYVANGTLAIIDTWYDQSGNGNHLSQIGGAAPPIMRKASVNAGAQSTVNGNTAVNYAGDVARDRLGMPTKFLSDIITASAFTVVINGLLFDSAPAAIGTEPPGFISDDTSGYACIAAFIDESIGAAGKGFYTNVFDGADHHVRFQPVTNGSTYVGISQLGGGNIKNWLNGGSPQSAASGNIQVMNNAHVVSQTLNSGGVVFYMLEILVYNTALSTADLNTLGNGAGITKGSLAARSGVSWTTLV